MDAQPRSKVESEPESQLRGDNRGRIDCSARHASDVRTQSILWRNALHAWPTGRRALLVNLCVDWRSLVFKEVAFIHLRVGRQFVVSDAGDARFAWAYRPFSRLLYGFERGVGIVGLLSGEIKGQR